MQTNFLLGAISLTAEARMVLKRLPYDLVARHALNDHGLITKSERKLNEESMRLIGPIVSRYRADPTDASIVTAKWVRIETDESWSNTLISIE